MLGNFHLGLMGVVAVACTSAALTSVGCAAPETEQEGRKSSESHFAILDVTDNGSVLTILEATKGKPDVCVGLIGYADAAERTTAFKNVQVQINSAANHWNGLLKGNALWSVQSRIQPQYRSQTTECASSANGFAVNLWKDAARFKNEYCAVNGMSESNCSSAAQPWNRVFFLGPWNRTQADNPLDGFTILHEYGHLLGLGDTYTIPGQNEFTEAQPASVMNGQSHVLTRDDALGLTATLRAVKTGVRSCEGIADEAETTANVFDSVVCNPEAVVVITHPGRPTGSDHRDTSSRAGTSSSGGSSSGGSSSGDFPGSGSSSGGMSADE